MNVGKAIYYLLSNAQSVTDIAGTRIYPELAEQEAVAPYAVYQIVSVNPDDTNDGPAVIDEVAMDILCVAESYNEAADLASAVRSALDRVRGTYNGVNVESIQYDSTDSDVQDSPRRYEQTVTLTVRVFRDAAQIATGQNIDQLTLGRLYDVTDDATTGQVIIKQADGTWAGGDAAGALGDLADVASDVTSEAIDRHALVYDEDSGEWIARYPGEIRVYNDSEETIVKGRCVTAIGSQGDMVSVRAYITTDDTRYVVGVATEEMAPGASGHAITIGEVRGLDTEGFDVGTILQPTNFVNDLRPFGMSPATAGAGQPDRPLPIAMVTRSHANTGRIQVRMFTPGYYHQLAALSDVNTPFPYKGAILKYIVSGGVSFWGYLPQTSKLIADGATEDIEIYYYAESDDTQLAITQRSDTPSAGNKIVRKIWYATASQADPDADVWTLYQTLADDATFAQLQAAFEASLLVSPTGGQPVSIKTTWEDIPAFTGLLDTYPGAAAAYSLRLLDADYSGSAINVRRASDNAVQDIGFDANGDLDTLALATFCAGTDGFVVTWYDQSGNGNDATQGTTSAQPKVYDSVTGAVTDNGTPSTLWSNAQRLTNETYSSAEVSDITVLSVASISVPVYRDVIVDSLFANADFDTGFVGSFRFLEKTGTGSVVTDQQYLLSGFRNRTANTTTGYANGAQVLSTNAGTRGSIDGISIGQLGGYPNTANTSFNFEGHISELVLYTSDQSANRTGIETNINDRYLIYNQPAPTGLLADYPGAAAAYSVRQLISTARYAMAVRRDSDDAVRYIGFDSSGNLDTATLETFCAGTNGYVAVWVDQSGNGNDAVQATTSAQPQIVASGSVITDGLNPALNFDGNYGLDVTNNLRGTTGASSIFATYNLPNNNQRVAFQFYKVQRHLLEASNTLYNKIGIGTNETANEYLKFPNASIAGQGVYTAIWDGSTQLSNVDDVNFYENGIEQTPVVGARIYSTTTSGNSSIGYNAATNSQRVIGKIQEVIVYLSDQSANRAGIESNINTYYSIY